MLRGVFCPEASLQGCARDPHRHCIRSAVHVSVAKTALPQGDKTLCYQGSKSGYLLQPMDVFFTGKPSAS